MHIDEHWLREADPIISPNFDERPIADDISLIVVHCISLPPGEFGRNCINDLFCNRLDPESHPYFKEIYRLKVSSHLLVKRNGDIVQYVPFDKRAWHAGVSNYEGRERCNDFSIGIELEGTEFIPYTDTQYHQLGVITQALLTNYPKLSRERITGHSNIAPGRKTDPGESFDWKIFYSLLSN